MTDHRKAYVRARDNRPAPISPLQDTSQVPLNDALVRYLLGMSATDNTVTVSDTTVSGLVGIGRGMDMIANAVASMMTKAKVYTGDEPTESVPLAISRPNPLYGSYEWWQMVGRTVQMRGNFIGIIMGESVVPVNPSAVSLDPESDVPVYIIGEYRYHYEQIVHVRSHVPVGGFWGMGIIERYRKSLTGDLFQQQYVATTYSNGGIPSGIVELDTKNPTQQQIDDVQDSWGTKYGGSDRGIAVTGTGVKFTPISWTPEDAQFVDARKLSIAEQALICGLRPEDLGASLGASGALSYGNRTDDALQRITDSYAPLLNLIEQAWSDLLPTGQTVQGDVEALFRSAPMERLAIQEKKIDLGVNTPDEIKTQEENK